MKLIIREYLASLRERKELDALLPDLLSEMGLHVFSKPGIGTRQYGVDIAAEGKIYDGSEKVYLFSVKGGDLGRKDWNSGSVQDLKPSLDEILDVYIPTHLPAEHRSKPVEICICIGGDIKEEVRLNISQYEDGKKSELISFSEWDGDKLSILIEKYLLKEELLPKKFRPLLRKSLALLDDPEVSYKHFSQLIHSLTELKSTSDTKVLTSARQLHLSLWILFAWCREANNLEAAYLSGELTILHAWEICKPFLEKKTKAAKAIHTAFSSIHYLYWLICKHYLQKILPHTYKLYALSNAVKPSCRVDVNLKLFYVLGRIAMGGIWTYWEMQRVPKDNEELLQLLMREVQIYSAAIKHLILNNPVLLSPYKDDQAIDIAIAVWFLALNPHNHNEIQDWLSKLINRVRFNFNMHSSYPCNLYAYYELIEHPVEGSDSYREEVTTGSILYPMIAAFAALLGFNDIYNEIQNFKNESLKHCNFQLWYPDDTSEERFYTNASGHGATLSKVCIKKTQKEFLEQIFKECRETPHFKKMSANKFGVWPIIFLGCRHYRLPVPVHFLEDFRQDIDN